MKKKLSLSSIISPKKWKNEPRKLQINHISIWHSMKQKSRPTKQDILATCAKCFYNLSQKKKTKRRTSTLSGETEQLHIFWVLSAATGIIMPSQLSHCNNKPSKQGRIFDLLQKLFEILIIKKIIINKLLALLKFS